MMEVWLQYVLLYYCSFAKLWSIVMKVKKHRGCHPKTNFLNRNWREKIYVRLWAVKVTVRYILFSPTPLTQANPLT